MSTQQFFIVLIVFVAFSFVYNLWRISTKILCRFTRIDKSIVKKWVTAKTNRVYCDGFYRIKTERIKWEKTFFNLLPVRILEFTYGNKYPVNPDTGKADAVSPEENMGLDKKDDITEFNLGSQRAYSKVKVGGMSGWLPIALVLGIVACLYLIFQMRGQIDQVGNALNVLQEMMMKSGMLK